MPEPEAVRIASGDAILAGSLYRPPGNGPEFARGGNLDSAIVIFSGADHRIRVGDQNGFAPAYLDMLGSWLRRRVGLA